MLERTLPWPWESFGAYLATLDRGLGVNVIAQVGHMAVRRYVMGPEASGREAAVDEVEAMRRLLADCLAEGGMGFTTTRAGSHWDGDGRPVPSRLASEDEYRTLVAELAVLRAGFVQLLAPDRDEDQLAELARLSGRGVCLNAIFQRHGAWEAWREDLDTHFRVLDSRNRDEEALLAILRSPYVIPGPSDAGAHLLRATNAGFPTVLLGHWVRERGALSLEQAVHLLAGRPARELGVRDRGLLRPGQAADVVLLDAESVAPLERELVDDLPGGGRRWIQRARGIEAVLVNGVPVLERGLPTGQLGGRTLRGNA